MKKTRHAEESIAFALKQAEAGAALAEVIRRMGISEQTFYRWKKVYGGLRVGKLRRLKLFEENGVTLDFSRPGKPTNNAFVESFNGRPRDECLNTY